VKYFLDTEFEPTPPAAMISIALVKETGEWYYAEVAGIADRDEMDFNTLFVRDHVLPELRTRRYENTHRFSDAYFNDQATTLLLKDYNRIRRDLIEFVGDDPDPQFYAWYGAQDWVFMVQIFDGLLSNMPKNWPGYYHELKVFVNLLGWDKEYTLNVCPKPKDAHFALADAIWNKDLWVAMDRVA